MCVVLIFLTDLADLTAACEPCLLWISSELGFCLVSCGCPGLHAESPKARTKNIRASAGASHPVARPRKAFRQLCQTTLNPESLQIFWLYCPLPALSCIICAKHPWLVFCPVRISDGMAAQTTRAVLVLQ